MQKIVTSLWFDTQAEEAANFYCSLFPDSKILQIARYGSAGPRPEGQVMVVDLQLRRPAVQRSQRRPAVHVHRGDLPDREL